MSESKLEMENKFNNVSNEEKNRQQKSDLIQKLFRVLNFVFQILSDLIQKLGFDSKTVSCFKF